MTSVNLSYDIATQKLQNGVYHLRSKFKKTGQSLDKEFVSEAEIFISQLANKAEAGARHLKSKDYSQYQTFTYKLEKRLEILVEVAEKENPNPQEAKWKIFLFENEYKLG